jgi:transcriptional regulator with XRE-family HTH domain
MATVGDRIRECREARGWTQERLAQSAGISKGFLSDLENDKRNVSSEYILKIANTLGVSLDYLVRGEATQRDTERSPVRIPAELSAAAQELNLTYAETLMLLDAHDAIIARRRLKGSMPLTMDEWKRLHKAIKSVYLDEPET